MNELKSNSHNLETYVHLLQDLIRIPSYSKEEHNSADYLCRYFNLKSIPYKRIKNNIIAKNYHFNSQKPSILLNSHIDTVKPNASYTNDPFDPILEEGKLFGLGSNDAGGCLVSLIHAFENHYLQSDTSHNIVFMASAEEEISGEQGVSSLIKVLLNEYNISFGIVGEPTLLQPAIAEKGLMVLDVTIKGIAGHVARNEGKNAIYNAIPVIEYFQNFTFPKVSPTLGPIKTTVSVINAGQLHNVVPDTCTITVDVRTTDVINNATLLSLFQKDLIDKANIIARGTKLNPSSISANHPIIKVFESMGCTSFGSPTLSDQALMPFPTVKIGPGDSARSHTADEFIFVQEILDGCQFFNLTLQKFL